MVGPMQSIEDAEIKDALATVLLWILHRAGAVVNVAP